MASDVDICNEALSHLGDSATVSSINPPEGSAQAEHCARFYPTTLATLFGTPTWAMAIGALIAGAVILGVRLARPYVFASTPAEASAKRVAPSSTV